MACSSILLILANFFPAILDATKISDPVDRFVNITTDYLLQAEASDEGSGYERLQFTPDHSPVPLFSLDALKDTSSKSLTISKPLTSSQVFPLMVETSVYSANQSWNNSIPLLASKINREPSSKVHLFFARNDSERSLEQLFPPGSFQNSPELIFDAMDYANETGNSLPKTISHIFVHSNLSTDSASVGQLVNYSVSGEMENTGDNETLIIVQVPDQNSTTSMGSENLSGETDSPTQNGPNSLPTIAFTTTSPILELNSASSNLHQDAANVESFTVVFGRGSGPLDSNLSFAAETSTYADFDAYSPFFTSTSTYAHASSQSGLNPAQGQQFLTSTTDSTVKKIVDVAIARQPVIVAGMHCIEKNYTDLNSDQIESIVKLRIMDLTVWSDDIQQSLCDSLTRALSGTGLGVKVGDHGAHAERFVGNLESVTDSVPADPAVCVSFVGPPQLAAEGGFWILLIAERSTGAIFSERLIDAIQSRLNEIQEKMSPHRISVSAVASRPGWSDPLDDPALAAGMIAALSSICVMAVVSLVVLICCQRHRKAHYGEWVVNDPKGKRKKPLFRTGTGRTSIVSSQEWCYDNDAFYNSHELFGHHEQYRSVPLHANYSKAATHQLSADDGLIDGMYAPQIGMGNNERLVGGNGLVESGRVNSMERGVTLQNTGWAMPAEAFEMIQQSADCEMSSSDKDGEIQFNGDQVTTA